jgi:hypothetical protein
MPRLFIPAFALISLLIATAASEAGEVRGKVVRSLCIGDLVAELRCRRHSVATTVDVTALAVDGSVTRETVATNRSGHFRLRLAPGYYILWARPPELGMSSMPAEFTVSSSPVNVTLRLVTVAD